MSSQYTEVYGMFICQKIFLLLFIQGVNLFLVQITEHFNIAEGDSCGKHTIIVTQIVP